MKPLREIVNSNKVLIAAHRGDSSNFPENTMVAFQSAVNIGVDMIELDVQFTKDKQIVVAHNETLRNTNQNISDLTFAQIKDFDNGSWFSNDFANERIPLLSDVLERFGDKVYFSIEVKPFFSVQTKNELTQLAKLISQNNLMQNVVIASFDTKNLSFIKSINSQINTAAVFDSRNSEAKLLPSDYKNKCGCDAIICSLEELNEEFAADATQNGIFIGIYGAKTKNDFEKCLANNVKVIGTGNCRTFVSIMDD